MSMIIQPHTLHTFFANEAIPKVGEEVTHDVALRMGKLDVSDR